MGYDLRQWALDVKHPSLTARTRQVLTAICMIAHDEHGEFYMRGQKFVSEHFPEMTYSTYRNHLTALVKSGLLLKVEHGGGRTGHGGGTTTRYRVNSPRVKSLHPPQTVLPDIVKSPEAEAPTPEVSNDPANSHTVEAYKLFEELLEDGISPEHMVEILGTVRETLIGSRNKAGSQGNKSENQTGLGEDPDIQGNMSGKRTSSGQEPDILGRNVSEKRTSLGEKHDVQNNVSEKQTSLDGEPDNFQSNLSAFQSNMSGTRTSYPIKEEERGTKEYHAAAANLSDSTDESQTEFFELLAKALGQAGHAGIRAAQFADLNEFLQNYTNLTGSPPGQRTTEYIVGRVNESNSVRNVVGFVRKLTQDVLTTGEGYVELDSAPVPPPERPSEPSPPPDWNLLHLAHSSAQEIWVAVSERLRGQVSRPAFETWVAEANGAAYAEGKFVVGSANSFASEMLKNRMHPQIERAVRDVSEADVIIEYAVVASDDRGECPLCKAGETKEAEAAS